MKKDELILRLAAVEKELKSRRRDEEKLLSYNAVKKHKK